MNASDTQGKKIGRTLQRWFDKCLPPEARKDRRWIGWLLLASIILIVIFVLFSVVLLLFLVNSVAQHGSGTMGGEAAFVANGPADFRHGISVAHWWLFGVLSIVPLSLFRLWWQYGRGNQPMGVHADLGAAEAGDGMAAYRLGQHYQRKDPASARAWLSRAAHAGVPEAMMELAQDLREGRGGPRDLASAQGWLLRASATGTPGAKELLAEVDARIGNRHSEQGI